MSESQPFLSQLSLINKIGTLVHFIKFAYVVLLAPSKMCMFCQENIVAVVFQSISSISILIVMVFRLLYLVY